MHIVFFYRKEGSGLKRIEFHIHTRYSKDSILNFWFLLILCKIKRIDCIAITDHNEIKGALKYQEKLEGHGIKVIVGEEIFTKDGEIIGLYLKEKIEAKLSVEETIQKIKEQGGLVYIPHPYEPYRKKTVLREEKIKEHKDKIDLIEVHNGRNRNYSISKKQEELADKYKLRKVVGSDAHTFFELGRNTMLIASFDRSEILQAIETGQIFSQKTANLFAHQWTRVVRLIKMIGRGEWYELYRIINRKCRRKDA